MRFRFGVEDYRSLRHVRLGDFSQFGWGPDELRRRGGALRAIEDALCLDIGLSEFEAFRLLTFDERLAAEWMEPWGIFYADKEPHRVDWSWASGGLAPDEQQVRERAVFVHSFFHGMWITLSAQPYLATRLEAKLVERLVAAGAVLEREDGPW